MISPVREAYVVAFGLAAVLCFASLRWAGRVDDPDTRRGLVALLALSGAWAGAHVGRIAAGDPGLKVAFYLAGLTVGLATVGAWLYFCSAYAGHDYHRRPDVRRLAAGVYLAIVAVKLTNPLHGLYFRSRIATEPFAHLAIDLLAMHWIVTGLAYALSAVGFYLLYELFSRSSYDTTSLAALAGLTALPVVFDLVGYLSPDVVLELNYEPIGVALFAVGTLYFVEEKFVAVHKFGRDQVVETLDEAIVLLDREGVVRDHNAAAVDLFPGLEGSVGEPLEAVAPRIAGNVGGEIVAIDVRGETRYYLADESPLSVGATTIGRALVFTDVTDVERQRRELQRQNEQLDDFADVITHELRNALAILGGQLELAGEAIDEGDADARSQLATAQETADRMTRVVGDLTTLARQGQTLDEVDRCAFREAVTAAWGATDTGEMTLDVEGAGTVEADPTRLRTLLSEAFRFARINGAGRVTVSLTPDGFLVEEDGTPLAADETEAVFEYGAVTTTAEAGMALPNVRTLARVHGWSVAADERYREGVRLVVSGAAVAADRIGTASPGGTGTPPERA